MPVKLLLRICIVLPLWLGAAYNSFAGHHPAFEKFTGRILDEDGNPLAGATVAVKGTNKAAVCNEKGEFTIDV